MQHVIPDKVCVVIDRRGTIYVDVLLILSLLCAPQILFANEPSTIYRIAENSVTSYVVI